VIRAQQPLGTSEPSQNLLEIRGTARNPVLEVAGRRTFQIQSDFHPAIQQRRHLKFFSILFKNFVPTTQEYRVSKRVVKFFYGKIRGL
jgi:hypothetical protein